MTRRSPGRRVEPFPRSRRVITDVGKVVAKRPTISGIVEADVTDVRDRIRRSDVSFTAFLVATLGEAVAEQPAIQAMRDWRGRLVIFDDVDVAVSVEVALEGTSFPLTHVIRGANRLSISEISNELRAVKQRPATSPTLQHSGAVAWYLRLPGPVRRGALRMLYRLPDRQRAIMGTVGLSSVGMMGEGGGWGFGLPVHTLSVLVGGISQSEGAQAHRLAITCSFDHDVVDGAPAARFVSRFRQLIESGSALDAT